MKAASHQQEEAEMNIKLKWKVQPEPTGRWRSFENRGWPMATFPNGTMAARIDCGDDYKPANVREGKHGELTLYLADYSDRGPGASAWKWVRVIKTFKTVAEAKEAAVKLYEKFPKYLPSAGRVN